jgi:acyl-CoA reductase-like NAD-dependent aldehyde dehydrogenase
MDIRNPANDQLLAQLPSDGTAEIAAKVARARSAQPAWAARPLAERLDALRAFRNAVHNQKAALALVLTREVGKPVSQALNELTSLRARLDFFLEHTAQVLASERVHEERNGEALALAEDIAQEPLGVVANISAWNYPWFVGSNVFVPALLTGNTVVYKPSEHATLTGLEIARLLHESGVPEDVFVPVIGAGDVGKALVEQAVDGVFFTGSYATGRRIAENVAPRLIKFGLELGGKDPTYVCDDVDVEAAAKSLADGAMYNTGQSCCSVERIYVQRGVVEEFLRVFVETVQGFTIGDPEDKSTYIGPLARKEQLAELAAQVEDARSKGARVLIGGKRMERAGNYFEPTVIADARNDMRLMREESFGPVIGIGVVDTDEQAVALMNDTDYGLTAGVYSKAQARAEGILRRVNAGSVYWNCCDRVSPRLPWTGRKHSGIGSTLSSYGIRTFTQPKAWHLRGA